jgi:ligand-binding sensor domain-containing protein
VAVVAVSPDGRGGCWLGTDTGQVVYTHADDPAISLFSLPQDPLPTITSVLAYRKRGAWVTTDRGIFAVRR